MTTLAARLAHADMVIVEGFARETIPRLEVVRPSTNVAPLYRTGLDILAIATDDADAIDSALPKLPLNDVASIGAFICKTLGIEARSA